MDFLNRMDVMFELANNHFDPRIKINFNKAFMNNIK